MNPDSKQTASSMPGPRSTIKVVFSDVDGTLAHYPTSMADIPDQGHGQKIIKLPASATGMHGILSAQTLVKCQEIRATGAKLVLVSGMRTTTLLTRLPFLPKADAYCSEAGGRIFWSRPLRSHGGSHAPAFLTVTPEFYDGATSSALEPFEIYEDSEWRQRMQDTRAAGSDGYPDAELTATQQQDLVPLANRDGSLWQFARQLEALGYVLDTQGYATCFRVNRKQQQQTTDKDNFFERLLQGEVLKCPPELATSTNLGCIDYYPVASGKKNCCQYVASQLLMHEAATATSSNAELLLSNHCVCVCDDDNDLEMALACNHAYIPAISSTSMEEVIASNPTHFSQTGGKDHGGLEATVATEKALALVLQRLSSAY